MQRCHKHPLLRSNFGRRTLARVTQIHCDVSNRAVFVFGPEHVLNSSLSWEKATEILDTLIETGGSHSG